MHAQTRSLLLVVVLCATAATRAVAGTTECVHYHPYYESAAGGISADGRYVVFSALGAAVDPGDVEPMLSDVFVLDRETGAVERVNVSSAGVEGADAYAGAMTPDGRFVVFVCYGFSEEDSNGSKQVFVRDRQTRATECVSRSNVGDLANQHCRSGSISADGRFVTFITAASNLVPSDTNGVEDVFVRDRALGVTERASVTSSGDEGHGLPGNFDAPAMSADGRFVAFSSDFQLVPEDTNPYKDIYVRDRLSGTVERVSVTSTGEQASYYSEMPAISADGRFVGFISHSADIFPGPPLPGPQLCIYDRLMRTIELGSVSSDGTVAGACANGLAISADGRFVAFVSSASNLVPADTNDTDDIFVRDRVAGVTRRVSVGSSGEQADSYSFQCHISATGRFVTFGSYADNLVPGDTNQQGDGFLRDQQTFRDVGLDHWAFYYIDACVAAGVVRGYPDGKYCPGQLLKRDRMAVYLARALAQGDENVPAGPLFPSFVDVLRSHWAYKYVEYLKAQGILAGEWGLYHPGGVVDRAHMAVYLARAMAGGDDAVPDGPATPSFADVPATYWAYKWVEYCHNQGVVQGYWDGYHPEEVVNRAQMAVYVQRAFQLPM